MAQQTHNAPPQVRTFQFDSDGIGAIKNSVNLFRGDVNYTFNILTLPARNNMEVSVDAGYSSNIQDNIGRWNRDAPTGILGLGWSLPFDRIEAEYGGTTAPEDSRFFVIQGGNRMLLLRSELEWKLFDAEADIVSLQSGSIAGDALVEEFAHHNIALAPGSLIETNDGEWRISDSVNERLYTLRLREDRLEAFDGGIAFETQSFQYWKISYYPEYERWMIVNESGMISVYGGNVSVIDGIKTSAGNVVQWGVAWGSWRGSSALAEGQRQYPAAWNRAALSNPWGDTIRYTYLADEQQVGDGGLTYTKACYQESIIDVFGRTVRFRYGDKVFASEPAAATREYMDPHKKLPDQTPDAFQSRYETRFLESIEAYDRNDVVMKSVHFDYDFLNVSGAATDDRLYGDTTKRILKRMYECNALGDSLPGLELGYYAAVDDPHPGALKSIAYPQGGVATYVYEKSVLPICERSLQVERPDDGGREYWTPRVWFGPDYAVVAWYNTDTTVLRASVYTWIGHWHLWPQSIELRESLDLETLRVLPGAEAFLLTFESDRSDRTTALLFHKLPNAPGSWVQYDNDITFEALGVDFATGDNFVLALDDNSGLLWRYTWNWKQRAWNTESFDLSETFCSDIGSGRREYFLTAGAHYYLVLCYDRDAEPGARENSLSLYYLDQLGQWRLGDTIHPNDVFIAGTSQDPGFAWAPGASFAAATAITDRNQHEIEYDLWIFHWNDDFTFTNEYVKELKTERSVQIAASVVDDSLVGTGPFLFRYNGLVWQDKNLGITLPSHLSNVFWFAYGADMALMTENGSNQLISVLGVYDPNTDSVEWHTEPRQLVNTTDPMEFRKTRYYPTAGIDYATLDRDIYYRDSSNTWAESFERPIYTIPQDELVDTTTMINQAPGFVAYLVDKDVDGQLEPQYTKVANLQNGRVRSVESFTEQIYRVIGNDGHPNSGLSGKIPAGPSSLFTYPLDQDLNDASHITLRRNLDAAVAGAVDDYSVISIEIDNGFECNYTSYAYDKSTAVCDPTGSIVKFYRVETFPGAAAPAASVEGRIESLYINGLPGATRIVADPRAILANETEDNFSVLDGFLDAKNTYDNDGRLVASEQNAWSVHLVINSGGEPKPIRGAFTLQDAQTTMQDGVVTTASNRYDLASGLMTRQDKSNYNSQGNPETLTELFTYGYQAYPELLAQNNLKPTVQTQRQVREQGAPGAIVTESSVTRWRAWQREVAYTEATLDVYDTYDGYVWRGGMGDPDFSDWNAE